MHSFDFNTIINNYLTETFIYSDIKTTFKEFLSISKNTANNLEKYGINSREKVALIVENKIEFLICLIAMLQKRVIAVLVNRKIPSTKLMKMLSSINCSKIIFADDFDSDLDRLKFNTFRITELVDFNSAITSNFKIKPITFSQDATIIFSSGSSGNPKPVLHTFGNHYFSALGSNENIPFKKKNRWLLSLPLYHVSGLSIIFRSLISGGTIVIPDQKLDLVANITKFSVTHLSLVPTQLLQLIKNKSSLNILKNLQEILIGGGYVPSGLIKFCIKNELPIFTTYGSTEMTSQITTTSLNDNPKKLSTSGRLLNYRKMKIEEDGEISVKGETLFKGYLANENLIQPFNADGWFQTGDLGKLDNAGYLTVFGRKDNMFISGGENIYPEEIEKYLLNLKEIENAMVIDIPDKIYGTSPAAFIKFYPNEFLSKKNLKNYLSKHLIKFKIPDAFYKWPDIEASLKPKRIEFKKFYVHSNPLEID